MDDLANKYTSNGVSIAEIRKVNGAINGASVLFYIGLIIELVSLFIESEEMTVLGIVVLVISVVYYFIKNKKNKNKIEQLLKQAENELPKNQTTAVNSLKTALSICIGINDNIQWKPKVLIKNFDTNGSLIIDKLEIASNLANKYFNKSIWNELITDLRKFTENKAYLNMQGDPKKEGKQIFIGMMNKINAEYDKI